MKREVLDFGFRQGIRIRSVPGVHTKVITPYEDTQWLAHWFLGPVSRRIQRRAFCEYVVDRYPEAFNAHYDLAPATRMTRMVRKLRKNLRGDREKVVPRQLLERGDPRKNASKRAVLEEALSSLDSRALSSGTDFRSELDELIDNPTVTSWKRVMTAVTVELHLRAGTI